jgi:hypothetical protein
VYRPGHALTDPFDCPGQADLIANVDFAYLAEALAGTSRPRSTSQLASPIQLTKYRSNDTQAALAASVHALPLYGCLERGDMTGQSVTEQKAWAQTPAPRCDL